MPIVVFLLILANLLFLAFTQGFFGNTSETAPAPQPVAADKLHIVSRGETPPLPAPPPPSTPPASEPPGEAKKTQDNTAPAKPATAEAAATKTKETSAKPGKPESAKAEVKAEAKPAPKTEICLAWNGLSTAEADRLATLFKDRPLKLTRHSQPAEVSQWWVYIPPLASKADADRKAGELKLLGISEFFIVQENGPNHFAISLGVFSSESGAKDQLAALKAQGVRSAKVGPRAGKGEVISLQVRGEQEAINTAKSSAAKALPKVQTGNCG